MRAGLGLDTAGHGLSVTEGQAPVRAEDEDHRRESVCDHAGGVQDADTPGGLRQGAPCGRIEGVPKAPAG